MTVSSGSRLHCFGGLAGRSLTELAFSETMVFSKLLKMASTLKESGLVRTAMESLAEVLREVPFLSQSSLRPERLSREPRADFIVSIRTPAPARTQRHSQRRLVCEVKSSGQPRIAREACLSLAEFARQDQRAYPVFIAPYISPAAAEVCEEYKAGYLDFAGNCRLAFDSVFIHKEGFPNPTVATRDLRSLYSPKAERVLRVLLARPVRECGGRSHWPMRPR